MTPLGVPTRPALSGDGGTLPRMRTFQPNIHDRFPVGTLVNVYGLGSMRPGDHPIGQVRGSATVTDDGLDVEIDATDLNSRTCVTVPLVAHAEVDGQHRYVQFLGRWGAGRRMDA